jgi:hypothetical protein
MKNQHQKLVAAVCLGLFLAICAAVPAGADCVRSCEAHLYMRLSYGLEGEPNVERKSELLKTAKSVKHDGRIPRRCVPAAIMEAKKMACASAVSELLRLYSSPSRQKSAVCEVVGGPGYESRSNTGEGMFPGAAWLQIDQMYAYGKRDAASARGEIDRIDRSRFRCSGDQVIPPSLVGRPMPTGRRPVNAPPPPPSMPSDADRPLPDLSATRVAISPNVPVKGQPVDVRITVSNRGDAPVLGGFTVHWFAGENYPDPACQWRVDRLPERGERVVECTYPGYPSAYNSINTKTVVDVGGEVAESNKENNVRIRAVQVLGP